MIGPGARRPAEVGGDAEEAAHEVERQRRLARSAAREAEARHRRAAAYAGHPLDPRAQGLWDAAAFHAARARAAAARVVEAEGLAAAIRERAEAARRLRASGAGGAVRPCA